LHLDIAEPDLQMSGIAAEARANGIGSTAGLAALAKRDSPTVVYLEQHRQLIVQHDCYEADVQPPPELMQLCGTKAQMMAPVVRAGSMVGWISVHYNPSVREWTGEDVAALEAALAAVHLELEQIPLPAPAVGPVLQTEPPPPETPVQTAQVQATKKVPEPDSLGG
jgi:GAF domain-containing protein